MINYSPHIGKHLRLTWFGQTTRDPYLISKFGNYSLEASKRYAKVELEKIRKIIEHG